MALISNGTTVASGGTVRGSATNLTSLPAPTTAQVLSATAGLSSGAVGSYALMYHSSNSDVDPGQTQSGSSLNFSSASNERSGTGSGTWRCLGKSTGNAVSSGGATTLYVRIS